MRLGVGQRGRQNKPDDDKRTYLLPREQLVIPPYHIPLRSLIAKRINNLLMAGRNLSADQMAMSSARVMTTAGMMGQAIGVAAALCIKRGVLPKDLVTGEDTSFTQLLEKEFNMDFDLSHY